MGWLQVTPEKQKEPRFEVFGWHLPDLPPDETMHNVWSDLGRHGRENTPLGWQEIDAFLRLSGEPLSHEETRLLREMSEAYCGELMNLSPFAKAPVDKVDAI